MLFRPEGSDVATWWPSAGAATALLMLSQRRWWPWLCGGIVVASALAGLTGGRGIELAGLFALCSAAEALVIAALLVPARGTKFVLDSPTAFFTLVRGCAAGAVVFGGGAGLVVASLGRDWLVAAATAAPAHLASTLIILPILLLPRQQVLTRGRRSRCGAVGTAGDHDTAGVLAVPHLALTFLSLPVLLWASLRLGSVVVSTQLMVLGVITTGMTAHGGGPFARGSEGLRQRRDPGRDAGADLPDLRRPACPALSSRREPARAAAGTSHRRARAQRDHPGHHRGDHPGHRLHWHRAACEPCHRTDHWFPGQPLRRTTRLGDRDGPSRTSAHRAGDVRQPRRVRHPGQQGGRRDAQRRRAAPRRVEQQRGSRPLRRVPARRVHRRGRDHRAHDLGHGPAPAGGTGGDCRGRHRPGRQGDAVQPRGPGDAGTCGRGDHGPAAHRDRGLPATGAVRRRRRRHRDRRLDVDPLRRHAPDDLDHDQRGAERRREAGRLPLRRPRRHRAAPDPGDARLRTGEGAGGHGAAAAAGCREERLRLHRQPRAAYADHEHRGLHRDVARGPGRRAHSGPAHDARRHRPQRGPVADRRQ